jgi:hypothetical protein
MTRPISSRLERTIAAGQDLIQQLCSLRTRAHLNALYVHVLSTCSNNSGEHAQELIGSMVLLTEPAAPALLAVLLDKPEQGLVTRLQAFVDARLLVAENPLNLITATTTLRLCHDSVRDFIADPLRCRVVDPTENHKQLSDRCLWLLNNYLREDMCNICDLGLANSDVADLLAQFARFVPEGVRYACLSWPVHLVASGSGSETMPEALLEFCTDHLLHWLEVLSLCGELSYASNHLPQAIAWCQVSTSLASEHCLNKVSRVISQMCLRRKRYLCS